jgi:hypothetical protein
MCLCNVVILHRGYKSMLRALRAFCAWQFWAGLGVILLGLGIWSSTKSLVEQRSSPALYIAKTTESFGTIGSGHRVMVAFELENRSNRALKIVGATRACRPQGCIEAVGLPLEIPPFSKVPLHLQVDTRGSGPFAYDITLFTDSPGQSRVRLLVTGRVT